MKKFLNIILISVFIFATISYVMRIIADTKTQVCESYEPEEIVFGKPIERHGFKEAWLEVINQNETENLGR